ncbi:MAG TPA: PDZ domain-containing protein, partial [Thermoanaerobaculia bacterium]|nr:PDZ domain-containing protein [Thermoanaerobaculia bacterium]
MQSWKAHLMFGLAAGLLFLPASSHAVDGDKAPAPAAPAAKDSVRQRVILIDDEGKSDKAISSITKRVPRGYLGVSMLDLTAELRAHFGVPEDAGVMVSKVESGSPAEKAGIKVGDILSGFDGKPAASSLDVRHFVRNGEDGTRTAIEVWRNGKVQTITAILEKRDRPEYDLAPLFLKKDGNQIFLHLDSDDPPGALPFKIETVPAVPMQRLQGREADLEKRLKQLETRIKD